MEAVVPRNSSVEVPQSDSICISPALWVCPQPSSGSALCTCSCSRQLLFPVPWPVPGVGPGGHWAGLGWLGSRTLCYPSADTMGTPWDQLLSVPQWPWGSPFPRTNPSPGKAQGPDPYPGPQHGSLSKGAQHGAFLTLKGVRPWPLQSR